MVGGAQHDPKLEENPQAHRQRRTHSRLLGQKLRKEGRTCPDVQHKADDHAHTEQKAHPQFLQEGVSMDDRILLAAIIAACVLNGVNIVLVVIQMVKERRKNEWP